MTRIDVKKATFSEFIQTYLIRLELELWPNDSFKHFNKNKTVNLIGCESHKKMHEIFFSNKQPHAHSL